MNIKYHSYKYWLKHRKHDLCEEQKYRNRLAIEVKVIFLSGKGKVGARTISALLLNKGMKAGRYLVSQLMKEQGLFCKVRKPYKSKNTNKESPYANVLQQHGKPSSANVVWVQDITYIKTTNGWYYLSVVMDLYSRRIIGSCFSNRMTADIVIASLEMARKQRKIKAGLIVHSDCGSQYTSSKCKEYYQKHGIIGSMTKAGNCYDNATMERFFGTLKDHLVVGEKLTGAGNMQYNINQWIELYYNQCRPHSSLGNLSPSKFELQSSINGKNAA